MWFLSGTILALNPKPFFKMLIDFGSTDLQILFKLPQKQGSYFLLFLFFHAKTN